MTTGQNITLVIGGARSGKSAYAENLCDASAKKKVYLATAEAGDQEMITRIQHHQDRRGPEWSTIEEPLALAKTLQAHANDDTIILVDCLALWLTNLLLGNRDIEAETLKLIDFLVQANGSIVFVTNEVGQGIVPENALARTFRDEAGRLNQQIAATADCVVLVTAGLPMALKGKLVTV